ncbi:endonuclease/exonuclease/phosphatase family protein [Sphaerisporangium corydalis]|uniref:Endonuclease/exonuclease/phosphatase family protein n=1 Tax=Sphaerisporangium corydalis TaxID=1441875 RepID=A0ABV9EVC4_9ACTN|nr:hypothetical protein [Sphaerisporangium corydalis]
MSQNILHSAHRDGRWSRLADVIRRQEPTVVLLQECRGWLDDDRAQIAQAEHDLGMRVLMARSPGSGHIALAYRPDEGLRWLGLEDHAVTVTNGYAAVRFAVDGLQVPLVLISAHLSCYSADLAVQEAQTLIVRAHRYNGLGIIGGDINHCPVGDPEPPWGRVQPHNRMIRCHRPIGPDQPWRANTIVGETFAAGTMIDVAGYLADTRGDSSFRAHTGVNGLVRVDQFHVTAALQDAIVDYQRVDPEGASDHYGILAVIDTDRIDQTKLRAYT